MVAGSAQLSFNIWNDLAQISGGGGMPSYANPVFRNAHWQITKGSDAEVARLWLDLLGADTVVVSSPASDLKMVWLQNPERFHGMPVLHDDGRGNTIRSLPRSTRSLARIVPASAFESLAPISSYEETRGLQLYTAALDGRPAEMEWQTPDTFQLRARVNDGQSVVVAVNYDSGWRAYSGETRLRLRPGPLGFIRIDAPAGDHDIRVTYRRTPDKYMGLAFTLTALIVVGTLVASGWGGRRESI
jgi:hypothetical protein